MSTSWRSERGWLGIGDSDHHWLAAFSVILFDSENHYQ